MYFKVVGFGNYFLNSLFTWEVMTACCLLTADGGMHENPILEIATARKDDFGSSLGDV